MSRQSQPGTSASSLIGTAEYVGTATGLVFFIPMVYLSGGISFLRESLIVLFLLMAYGCLAGTIISLIAGLPVYRQTVSRGVCARLGVRVGLIVSLVGGATASVVATLSHFKVPGFIQSTLSPGLVFLVTVLSVLPTVLVASLGAVFPAIARDFPSLVESDPLDSQKPMTPWFFPLVIGLSILGYLSPLTTVSVRSSAAVETSEPQPVVPAAPSFRYSTPDGFGNVAPSQWKVVHQKFLSDLAPGQPLALSSNGTYLAYVTDASPSKNLRIFDLDRFERVTDFSLPRPVALSWSPGSDQLFCITESDERRAWVLELESHVSTQLPIPKGNQLPSNAPLWARPESISFPSLEGGTPSSLDLNTLNLTARNSSISAARLPASVLGKTNRVYVAYGSKLTSYARPGFNQKNWENQWRTSVVVKDETTVRVLPEIPSVAQGDRAIVSWNGSKLIVVNGGTARIHYFGIEEPASPLWTIHEMPDTPNSVSFQSLKDQLSRKLLCVVVCAPLINPLNEEVVGPDRENVKGLARVISWEGLRANLWIAEEYQPLADGDVAADLHVWEHGEPVALDSSILEAWWATVSHPNDGQDTLKLSAKAEPLDRRFEVEMSRDKGGLVFDRFRYVPPASPAKVETEIPFNTTIVAPTPESIPNALPSQASPKPTSPPRETRVTEDELRRFIMAHHEKASRKDLDGFTSDYADRVLYYDKGVVTRKFIQEDQRNYFGRYLRLAETVDGPIELEPTEPHRFEASYLIDLGIVRTDGKQQTKKVKVSVEIDVSSGSLKIISEDSEVIQTSGEPREF